MSVFETRLYFRLQEAITRACVLLRLVCNSERQLSIHILAVHAQDLTHKEINITIILDSDKNHILNAVCEAS